ncbi:ArsR/SmtB family transcription factor [Halorientalis litorea]|jgi:DNA-binding transcriptional ArsR family regulator|uniref:ArsR/SmtB family transcription factor n=1 Tax=Halorientalis litorea TaxID=2931977 RepID=UPI001FF26273|nr:winged helix-turn-helix domain-containing protein [Halorientalis litorea]
MTVNESQTRSSSAPPTARSPGGHDESDDSPDIPVEELLDLLGDEYVCDILRALAGGEMPARDIADQCEMSRPTVYRRLDRLTDAGVVESRVRPEADGHHRQGFRLALDEVAFRVREDGFDSSVRVRDAASD